MKISRNGVTTPHFLSLLCGTAGNGPVCASQCKGLPAQDFSQANRQLNPTSNLAVSCVAMLVCVWRMGNFWCSLNTAAQFTQGAKIKMRSDGIDLVS